MESSKKAGLFIIGLVSSLGVFAGSLIAPVEARYIESFSDNPVIVGSVFGVGSIFFVLLSYWIGRYSDTHGRKRTILVGLFFGVVYSILYSLVLNTFQIYGVKFAWAISAAATGPVLAAYLQDFLETVKSKGQYFGYIYSAQSISGSAGALIGGYVADAYGLKFPFLILIATYVALFIIVSLFLPTNNRVKTETDEQKKSLFKTFNYVKSKPALRFYLSVNIGFGINWGIKLFLWPLVIFELASSDLVTGSIFATMGLVAFILLPFAGKLVDKFGSHKIMLVELLILGTTGVGLALTSDIAVFWVLAAIYTIGEVLNGPAQGVLLTENVDSHLRGEIMALDAIMDQVLLITSPFLAGILIYSFGLQTTLLMFMFLYWVSLGISLKMFRAN